MQLMPRCISFVLMTVSGSLEAITQTITATRRLLHLKSTMQSNRPD
ncbi:hypothetical protein RGAI101_94 [Roseobacter sp. GAI101]|nr:hypothetical protein RGAI101_94 [Roseobacter sp. GAI101]